jgi:hypothetical protein
VVPVPRSWAGSPEFKWSEDGLLYPGDLFEWSMAMHDSPVAKYAITAFQPLARTKKRDVFKARGPPRF